MSFYTETIQADPRFNSMSPCHDMLMLEPIFRKQVSHIINGAKNMGLDLRAVETYRSQELQEHYFDKGTTQLQTVGVHHYGLACDLVVFADNKPDWNRDYSFLGHLAAAAGVIWGGDWGNPNVAHSFRDMDHVQRVRVEDQPKLFDESWYPGDTYTAVSGVLPLSLPEGFEAKTPAEPVVKQAPAELRAPIPVTDLPKTATAAGAYAEVSAKLKGNEKLAWDIVTELNATVFSSWFYCVNVMAFLETESHFDFNAFRQEPSGVASYGVAQVLDITAKGLGYEGSPDDMYDPHIGIHLGMMAMCQNWNVLAKRLGRNPSIEEWVEAYNEGAGNVIKGKDDSEYYDKWMEARTSWLNLAGLI